MGRGRLSACKKKIPAGGFRWRYLRRSLAPFEGVTTPRDFVSLRRHAGRWKSARAPVAQPELVYDWISSRQDRGAGSHAGTGLMSAGRSRWARCGSWPTRPEHFDSWPCPRDHRAGMLSSASRCASTAPRRCLLRALEEREMLTREMSHRLKNVFRHHRRPAAHQRPLRPRPRKNWSA